MTNQRKAPGKRHNVWILERHSELWASLENRSKFLQLALDQAAGVMAWGILQERDPNKYELNEQPTTDELEEFNEAFPLNELTKTRTKPSENSAKKPEIW